jgi:dTDP-4-dehydrorhamnose reductase
MEKNSKKPLVIVTGASGMLGKALVGLLSDRYKVLGISKRGMPGYRRCDLSVENEVNDLFTSQKPVLLIHAAAYSDVDGCERDPKLAFESNVMASKYLSNACFKNRVPWIYVSTDYVFDGQKKSPYTETDAAGPVNIYGMTKWCGEFYALNNSNVHSAAVRTSWLFGPENPSNFVNAMLERLQKEKVVSVLDDQTDSPTYVKDLSVALVKIGEHLMAAQVQNPQNPAHEVFHVCNAGAATRHEMALRMKEWLNLNHVKVEKADRSQIKNRLAIRPAYAVMSTRRYENFFHSAMRPWQESLREYLNETVLCAS